jgi:hypothetical protein
MRTILVLVACLALYVGYLLDGWLRAGGAL